MTPRVLTLITGSALAAWFAIWFGWLAPPEVLAPVAAVAIALIPLALIAYPLARDRMAGYAWCGFITLGYMAQALVIAFADAAQQRYAFVELLLVGILFAATSAALRARARQAS